MLVELQKRKSDNANKYPNDDISLAAKFTKKVYDEFGKFLRAVVLFGGAARGEKKTNDIDVLVIVDDISLVLSAELTQTYRIVTEKVVSQVSTRIHVTSIKFTTFWELVRVADPVAINMLRDGVALLDTGFFDPLQVLLLQGRIRPTNEAVWTYYSRAPNTLTNSKWHITQATLDLYWGVIDAAHAAVMSTDTIPPTPAHVADLLDEKFCAKGLLEKKYVETMRMFYDLSKKIVHREIKEISGTEYAKYLLEAEDFVNRMRKLIEKR